MSARIVEANRGMAEAVDRLRRGELVAFPTETVYGLGANALDASAVARIYAAKGRPATNPLIVHIADTDAARTLAGAWPEVAERLAGRFWPGPLTLVVQRPSSVPDIVTAGGHTVGLRVPAHPVALELLQASGLPIAAPSANRSEEVSPTTAQHVADSLGPYVDDLLILDGGPCAVGLESTVLDVTTDPPRILRPGMVTPAHLADILGEIRAEHATEGIARSPGQMVRHYSPRHPIVLLSGWRDICATITTDDVVLAYSPLNVDWSVLFPAHKTPPPQATMYGTFLPLNPDKYAAGLYAALRQLDNRIHSDAGRILVELPPTDPEWYAIHDRLRRAATPKGHEE